MTASLRPAAPSRLPTPAPRSPSRILEAVDCPGGRAGPSRAGRRRRSRATALCSRPGHRPGPARHDRGAAAARAPAHIASAAWTSCRTCTCWSSTPTRKWCAARARAASPALACPRPTCCWPPLNRPSHYLKPRDGRPDIESWLNPRMLYRIPRSQVTTGVRALGRLAFCDNYRLIARRLLTELDACIDPDALATAAAPDRPGAAHQSRPASISSPAWPAAPAAACSSTWPTRCALLLKQMGYEQPDVVGLLLLPRRRPQPHAHADARAIPTPP